MVVAGWFLGGAGGCMFPTAYEFVAAGTAKSATGAAKIILCPFRRDGGQNLFL
jgi:hypothetical protein